MGTLKFLIVLMVFMLSACVQVPVNSDTRMSNLAVTSVWDMPTKLTSGTSYSISPQHLKSVARETGEIKNAYQRYADGIKANLNAHGFQEQTDAKLAQLHVRFMLALSEDLDDQTISEQFGITPGLQDSQEFSKGSLLISITQADTGQRVWHGAIQGFVQEDATEEERDQRRRYVLNMVLAQFHKPH